MDTVTVAVAVTLVAIAAWWLVPWPFDARRMRGWRVVVCGASTGLGEDIVYEYARAACEIAVVARTRELLERVAAKAEQLGATRVHVIEADLAGQDNCAAVVARAVAAFGGPFDVLVLNQLRPFYGVLHDDPAKFGEIEKIFAVNAFSYFYLALHALPHLTARDGRIVVNSSMTAKVPLPFVVPYGASKHAVEGFFCDLRVDIERTSKVSITIALIGQIDTPRGRNTLGRSLSHLHHLSSAQCAAAVVAAAGRRDRAVYFPYIYGVVPVLYSFLPWAIERLNVLLLRDLDPNAPSKRAS